jgi:hypothetical protein
MRQNTQKIRPYSQRMKSPDLSTRQPDHTRICDPAFRVFGCII